MKLSYINQADDATITTSAAEADYPITNVQHPHLSKIYKSGDTDIAIDIDAGGGVQEIYQEYTNLIEDGCDLTTANWNKVDVDVTDSGQTINGEILWTHTLTSVGVKYNNQNISFPSNGQYELSAIIKKGNAIVQSAVSVYDQTALAFRLLILVNFSTKNITESNGTLLGYEWLDDDTVKLHMYSESIISANTNNYRLYVDRDTVYNIGDYVYFTMPQVISTVDSKTMFPFVDGTHTADVINETFTMPDKFAIRIKVNPKFAFDIGTSKRFIAWHIDTTHQLLIYYEGTLHNKFFVYWVDGGMSTYLASYELDDGSAFTNLNQKFDLIVFLDLTTTDKYKCMFIAIPQESGSINIDNSWHIAPNVKSLDYPTLSIGNLLGTDQANSDIEYLRIYGWGSDKPTITSSADADEYFADEKLLLDKTYQHKLTATDLYLANSTIGPGSAITLQANNYTSWGTGTPVEETITWSEDIISKTFTKASYQYWRLNIKNSTDINIGRLWLGESIEIAGPHTSFVEKRINTSETDITDSGQAYGDIGYVYREWNMTYPYWNNTEKSDIEEFADAVNKSQQFFATFADTGSNQLGPLYCIMTNNLDIQHLRTLNIWASAINFRETF